MYIRISRGRKGLVAEGILLECSEGKIPPDPGDIALGIALEHDPGVEIILALKGPRSQA
ncbi:hypothetical protein ACFL5M_06830 [Candidatus Neomarinimicrobiota bacterium]